jgi:hypothetical protein
MFIASQVGRGSSTKENAPTSDLRASFDPERSGGGTPSFDFAILETAPRFYLMALADRGRLQ